jgi:Leucine-rich repeat (LRR) protein
MGITNIRANGPSTTTIECSNNILETIDFTELPSLTSFTANNNVLSIIDLTSIPTLKLLRVDDNSLTALDTTILNSLTTLSCNNNQIETLKINSPLLTTLRCDNNQISELDLSACIQLQSVNINNNPIVFFSLPNRSTFTKLQITYTNLASLDLSNKTVTTSENNNCNLSFNHLSNVNLSNFKLNGSSGSLYLNNNNLSSLDVSALALGRSYPTLDLSNNNLSDLDFDYLQSYGPADTYVRLNISYNNFSSIIASKSIAVNHGLELVDVSYNPNLEIIDRVGYVVNCSHCNLKTIKI